MGLILGVVEPPEQVAPDCPSGIKKCIQWDGSDCIKWECQESNQPINKPDDAPLIPSIGSGEGLGNVPILIMPAKPYANFSYRIYANGVVKFTNLTLGIAKSYFWNFKNGQYSTIANPRIIFETGGSFDIELTAKNKNLTNTMIKTLVVDILPAYVDFTYAISGLNVAFRNISTIEGNPSWGFGDGTFSSEEYPNKLFAVAGTYDVWMKINGINKRQYSITVTEIVAGGMEDVEWTNHVYTQSLPNSNDLRKLSGSNWAWDGDAISVQRIESPLNEAGITFSIINYNAGAIAIGLNNANGSHSWTDILYGMVFNRNGNLWYAQKGATPSYRPNVRPLETDVFSMILDVGEDEGGPWIDLDLYMNGTLLYIFNLDESDFPLFIDTSFERPWDNLLDEESEIIPNYLKDVQINTTGTGGGSSLDFPKALFGVDVVSGVAPLTVHITDMSTGASSYLYDFQDGQTETFTEGDHTFEEPGTYTIRQTVYNDLGENSYEITIVAYEELITPPDDGVIKKYLRTDGYNYYLDGVNHKILIYDSDNNLIGDFGSTELSDPTDILLMGNCILVVDRGNNKIFIYDTDGVLQSSYGSAGSGQGQFNAPFGIAYNGIYIYVTDTNNKRIQYFTFDEITCSIIAYAGEIDLNYYPYGISFDENFMYVVDKLNCLLNVYTLLGNFIASYDIPCGEQYVISDNGNVITWGDDDSQILPINPDFYNPEHDYSQSLILPNSIFGIDPKKLLLTMNVVNAEGVDYPSLTPLLLSMNIVDAHEPLVLTMNVIPDIQSEYIKNPQMPSYEVTSE
jgi:PKD repeat protein